MLKPILFLFISFISCSVFSQDGTSRINISNDIELIRLSENAYIHVSHGAIAGVGRFASNGLIFIQGNEAFLFDSPVSDSLTKDLVKWLEDSMHLTIRGFIPNHWHIDCMGGLSYIQGRNIESFANQMTLDIARANGLPVPAHGFTDSLRLMLGAKEIVCYYLGAAHSTDNIVVWIPSEKILFAGCMLKSIDSYNLGNTKDGDLDAYPKTLLKVKEKFPDAAIVIPGHGDYGGTELIDHTLKLAQKK